MLRPDHMQAVALQAVRSFPHAATAPVRLDLDVLTPDADIDDDRDEAIVVSVCGPYAVCDARVIALPRLVRARPRGVLWGRVGLGQLDAPDSLLYWSLARLRAGWGYKAQRMVT